MAFDFNEVRDAYERIRPYVRRTLLEESFYLGDGERRYFFKLESLQRAKSFKIRGALNKMLTLTAEEAGSLLDSYTLISESDGTLVYELTAAEYTALLQQLEQQGLAIAGAATAEEAEADGTILVHVIPG